MKKIIYQLIAIIVLAFSLAQTPAAHAQEECRDAAGAVIPCPPTENPTGGSGSDNSGSGGGSSGSPTNTPMPIIAPTEDTGTAKGASWSGTCKGSVSEVARCIGLFHNGCKHVGGKVSDTIENGEVNLTCTVPSTVDPVSQFTAADDSRPNEDDYLGSCTNKNLAECREVFTCEDGLLVIEVALYASGGTRYDFYCIPHDRTSELPFAIPPSDGENDNWTGSCNGKDMDQCIDTLSALCDEEGGDLSVWYDDGGTGAGLYCENMSEARQPAPTETPPLAAVPQEPSEPEPIPAPTFPPGGWLPWITGFFGVVLGLLLPAVQKVRDSAARSGQTKEHVLLNKEDPQEAKKIFLGGLSAQPEPPQPQTREHILLANQADEPQEAFDPFLKLDGIPGETKDSQPAREDSIGREDIIKREDKDKG
jgi:hypothetical protein